MARARKKSRKEVCPFLYSVERGNRFFCIALRKNKRKFAIDLLLFYNGVVLFLSMSHQKKEVLFHRIFEIGIVVKGVDGILELIGGVLLLSFKSQSISTVIQTIFRHELTQDPTDILANFFLQFSHQVSENTIFFAAIYLIIHGVIKLGLFVGLWYKKLWMYPLAGCVMAIFVAYQVGNILHLHSIVLALLTMIDLAILVLLRFEYKRIQEKNREIVKILK